MNAYFPISQPMIGSVIPGVLVRVTTRLANFPDGSLHPLIKRRHTTQPITSFPDMQQEHSKGHPILEKLRQLMSANGPRHPHAQSSLPPHGGVRTMKGYEPQREDLSWRRS